MGAGVCCGWWESTEFAQERKEHMEACIVMALLFVWGLGTESLPFEVTGSTT